MLSEYKKNKLAKIDDIFQKKSSNKDGGLPPYIIFTVDLENKTTTACNLEGKPLPADISKKLKVKAILQMFQKTLGNLGSSSPSKKKGQYEFKNNVIQVPVWMKDFPPSKYGFLNEVKICVFAREQGDPRYILFPDETFEMFNFKTYDENKKDFESAVKKTKKMVDEFHFEGTDSTRNKQHNLRRKLHEAFPDRVILTEKDPKENITENVKYKYILNLPGSNLWNDRFKFIALASKSEIINVKISIKNLNSGFVEKPSETFFENAFLEGNPDAYTIPIEMEFYDYNDSLPNNESVKEECERLNNERIGELVNTLKNYKKFKKPKKKIPIKGITNDKVYQYLYELLMYFDSEQ